MTATTDETLASAADVKLALEGNGKPALTKEEQLALIKVNLAEFLNPEIIEKAIDEGRHPRIYWGKISRILPPLQPPTDMVLTATFQEPRQLVSGMTSSRGEMRN